MPQSVTEPNVGRLHRLHYKKGDTARAIADYNKAILLDPTNAQAFANRSLAYSNEGNTSLAKADSIQARKLDPKIAIPKAGKVTAPYVLENPYGWPCPPPFQMRTGASPSVKECYRLPSKGNPVAACAEKRGGNYVESYKVCYAQVELKRNQMIVEAAQSAADWEAAIAERKQHEQEAARRAQEAERERLAARQAEAEERAAEARVRRAEERQYEQEAARRAQEVERERLAARQAEAEERAAEARVRRAEERQRAAEAHRRTAEAAVQERQRAAEVRQRAEKAAAAARQRAAEEERRTAEAEGRAAEAEARAAEAERRAAERERAKQEAEARRQQAQREAEARRQQAQREAETQEMHRRGIFGVESLYDIVNSADHNTVRFERYYKGKTFSGVGAFNQIGEATFGFGDNLALHLLVGNREIVCFIDKSKAGVVADWRAGNQVRFSGTISNTALLGKALQLQDCSVSGG